MINVLDRVDEFLSLSQVMRLVPARFTPVFHDTPVLAKVHIVTELGVSQRCQIRTFKELVQIMGVTLQNKILAGPFSLAKFFGNAGLECALNGIARQLKAPFGSGVVNSNRAAASWIRESANR